MKSQMRVAKLAAILVLKSLFFSTASLAGQTRPAPSPQPDLKAVLPVPAQHEIRRVIVVSLADRRLALLEDGQVKQIYTVAVGKDTTPSPTGTFTILDRVSDPTYYHDGKVIPPGPDNPVGNRWIGLSKSGYGIHGTNAPHSIGKAASHGCIRMSRRDLENLFAQVRAGDTVEIIGDRNQETAALFAEPATPATAPALVQTVAAQSDTTPAASDTAASPAAQ